MVTDQRDPLIDWRPASMAALLFLLGIFGLLWMAFRQASGEDVDRAAGAVRALFLLPLLVAFVLLAGARLNVPLGLRASGLVIVAGLAAWVGLETGDSFFGEDEHQEWKELLLNGVVTLGLVAFLGAGLREWLGLHQQLQRGREDAYDSLTGLLNRKGLQQRYALLAAGTPVTLLMLDLNRLKAINDAGGHAAGDAYIRSATVALRQATRASDLLARWGGDEFLLVLPGCSEASANSIAERSARQLAALDDSFPPFAYGMATAIAGEPLERTLAVADARMYEHKELQRQQAEMLGHHERFGPTVEEFTRRLEQFETPTQVLRDGLTILQDLLGFEVSVYLARHGHTFAKEFMMGDVPEAALALNETGTYDEQAGVIGQVIRSGGAVWSNDYPREPNALPAWVDAGLKTTIAVPVRHSGQIVGVIGLMNFRVWRVVLPQARRLLESLALRLTHALERDAAVEHVKRALEGGMLALGVGLEERDLETAGHTERVVEHALRLGSELGLTEVELDALRLGGYLHDIGKLAIPDAVLLKPGRFTPDEWSIMKSHAERGYVMARRLPGLPDAALDVIRSHHERWDGQGYPAGLAGEAIPLLARIFAVVDVYDALTSVRPYKEAWTPEDAMAEVLQQSGRQFDPRVVQAFARIMRIPVT